MKPAICYLCGKSALDESSDDKGNWVEFEDYKKESVDNLSHPIGLEYFCNEHFSEANRLKHKKSDEALIELKKIYFVIKDNVILPSLIPSWWQRLMKR